MSIIANAADRLLSVIVPRATAAAWSCQPNSHRVTCFCSPNSHGVYYWWQKCIDNTTGQPTKACTITVHHC
jgi:hypothetical protein